MAEGQLKRIQPDIVEEVESCEGGSFSEKLRQWKLKEIKELTGKIEERNNSLTQKDVQEAVEKALPSNTYR